MGQDSERRFAIAVALLFPWVMLLVTDWTVTPVGMIDGWIYRALGRDLVQSSASMSEYYYVARPFVLLPRYLLTRFMLEGPAHAAYGLLCTSVLLLAVLDLLTSIARPGSRLVGVLLFGSCVHLLRSLGWGYIDGSLITWFMVGLACVARWYQADRSPLSRLVSALVAGGCFAAMLTTHPMTVPMLLTPLLLVVWLQRQTSQPRAWLLWLQMTAGGLLAVVMMGLVCEVLFGRFLYFKLIVEVAIGISAASWKKPLADWLPVSNWLVLLGFGWLVAAASLALTRVRLTLFERFAWLNALVLITLMVALESFTKGYWLEYPWFASYFVPSALLALAATLGERVEETQNVFSRLGLTAAFVLGAVLAIRIESPFFVPPFAVKYFPFRVPVLWLQSVPLIAIQLALAVFAIAVLVVWRRQARPSSLLVTALVAMVVAAPINQISPGDAVESEASASVGQAITVIQDELGGRRPVYWYDNEHSLSRLFVTISSAHLAYFSQLQEAYPRGALALRGTGHGTQRLFQTGDPVVILDSTPDRFSWAQLSFAEIGISLKETRRIKLQAERFSYWIIFATLEPSALVLNPADLPTGLKNSVLVKGERVSEREAGFLSFGPYVPLAEGDWRVTFHLRLLNAPSRSALGMVDVGDFSGGTPVVFQSAPLVVSAASANGELDATLEFTLKTPTPRAEFRVSTDGNVRLALRSIEVQRLDTALSSPFRVVPGAANEQPPEPVDAGSAEADAEFLKALYRELLGREADPSGLAASLSALAGGMSRDAIRQNFLSSPEYLSKQAAKPKAR